MAISSECQQNLNMYQGLVAHKDSMQPSHCRMLIPH